MKSHTRLRWFSNSIDCVFWLCQCLLIALPVCLFGEAVAEEAVQWVRTDGAKPEVVHTPEQQAIFTSGKGGYHTYRIPALAITSKGTILAFCEGRRNSSSDHGDIDLLLRRSFDNGESWRTVQTIWDDGDNTIGNPCPVVDKSTGAIWLLFCRNNDRVFVTKSTDDGATWTDPTEITSDVKPSAWTWYATGPGHGIQLSSSRLLVPCDHRKKETGGKMFSHVFFSDDHGKSWQLGGSLTERTDECMAVETADGGIYLNMRSYRKKNRRAVARSQDGGQTWSDVTLDQTLIEPVCQASLTRLTDAKRHDKNRILFANPASKKREKMTVRISYDEGITWSAGKELNAGPSAYSDLVVTQGGTIGCLYERGEKSPYETITFARLGLDWLTDGEDSLAVAAQDESATAGETAEHRADESPSAPHPFVYVCEDAAAGGYEAFPDVCRLNDGRLMAVFYAGYGHVSLPNEALPKGGRICYCTSPDEGRTWSKASILYDSPDDDRDPSVVQLKSGQVICNFFSLRAGDHSGKRWTGLGTWMVSSDDLGRTWSEPKQLADNYYCSAPIRELSDGRLMLGLYREMKTTSAGAITFSDDGAKTWRDVVDIDNGGYRLDAETDVIERQDGTLYAIQRPEMCFSISNDRGRTWSVSQPIGFAGHAPYLHRTNDGIILLAHRVPSTSLHYSLDECQTWSDNVLVDTTGGAYPSMVNLKDGSVLIVYYEEGAGSSIRAKRFRASEQGIEWLIGESQ